MIVGAGPGGAACALYLAKLGITCTIIDKATFPRDKICGDALSGKVVEVLKKIDPAYVDELAVFDKGIGSWGVSFVAPSGQMLRVPFSTNNGKRKYAPGFIAKRIDFDNFLVERLRSNPLISLIENTEVREYTKNENGFEVKAKSGQNFQASLVIAADGANSSFAHKVAGLEIEPDHNCFGLRAYYRNVAGMDKENFIELHFIKNALPGYFWAFPLANNESNIGIGIRADMLKKKNINLKKLFQETIEIHPEFKQRFAHAEMIGEVKLHALPLGSKKRKISGDNYMLLGDAGMLIDPFTGEGIGNAMLSGIIAAQKIADCMEQNDFSRELTAKYDDAVYKRLWSELLLSYRLQQLVKFPWLFNFVVRKANSNSTLRDTISCMFEDVNLRNRFKDPLFYFKLLFGK